MDTIINYLEDAMLNINKLEKSIHQYVTWLDQQMDTCVDKKEYEAFSLSKDYFLELLKDTNEKTSSLDSFSFI